MHFPTKTYRRRNRRRSTLFTAGPLRSRRNAVIELTGERERQLEMLFMAICSGDTNEMEEILRSRSSSTFCDASTDLLNSACATGNPATVQILLQNGIPFRSVGGKGDAPLHTAVRRGSVDIAKILLDHEADVNVETKFERRTPLHLASASRKLDVLKFLLENEPEVDKADIYGSTALHLAAETGFSNGVGALLESHADPDVFNRDGWTAMHLAAANGHLSVVEQLVAAHATVDCQNRFGRTPLHWACAKGHLQVARLLLKHNASIEVRDKNERTAFDHAATRDIRNLIDATSSVTNLSVIPRISSGMHYVIGESTLRLSRASAFVDALERARWSSNISSDSGIDCPPPSGTGSSPDDEEGGRWSYNGDGRGQRGGGGGGGRQRRQRKTAIWSEPEGWRPLSAPGGASIDSSSSSSATGNDLFHPALLLQTNYGQLSTSSRSISAFGDTSSPNELSSLWPPMQWDTTQRRHSEPYHVDRARQLGRFLSPIQEDDKTSNAGTSLLETPPTKCDDDERTRPGFESKLRRRPPVSKPASTAAVDWSEEESTTTKGSRKESDYSDWESLDGTRTSAGQYCSRQLTRDLEKILKRVSLASEKGETMLLPGGGGVGGGGGGGGGGGDGVGRTSSQSSHVLIGALNSGLKQLLTQLGTTREEEHCDDLFSEA